MPFFSVKKLDDGGYSSAIVIYCPGCGESDQSKPGTKPDGSPCEHPTQIVDDRYNHQLSDELIQKSIDRLVKDTHDGDHPVPPEDRDWDDDQYDVLYRTIAIIMDWHIDEVFNGVFPSNEEMFKICTEAHPYFEYVLKRPDELTTFYNLCNIHRDTWHGCKGDDTPVVNLHVPKPDKPRPPPVPELLELTKSELEALPFELEGYITDYVTAAPPEAQKIFNEHVEKRISSAIAKHPKYGWFVICTAGQGPMILWDENTAFLANR